MSFDTMHESQRLPIQQAPFQHVQTILICKNSLVRAGIRHILNGTRFTVAGELEDSSTLAASQDAPPNLYLLDDSYSADALDETVADLKAQHPSARVVVLADQLEPVTMMRAWQAGVAGLCTTKMERNAIIAALELVMLGETFIPTAFLFTMLNGMFQAHESRQNMPLALTPAGGIAMSTHKLSSREVEILEHLMEGESNKLIARNLHIAEATIKVHIKTILRKLRATNRTQAAMWAATHLSPRLSSEPITQSPGSNELASAH